MANTISTRSEDLEQIKDSENIPVGEEVTDDQLVCGFLKVIQGNRTFALVEAQSTGTFTWVFSKNGKVTSTMTLQLFAGQRADATADGRSADTVGIACN